MSRQNLTQILDKGSKYFEQAQKHLAVEVKKPKYGPKLVWFNYLEVLSMHQKLQLHKP